MKMNLRPVLAATLATAALYPGVVLASAQGGGRDIGAMATAMRTMAGSVNGLVTVVAFIIGVVLAISGILKFKAHSANPNDPSAKLSTAFMLMFAGAALVALPALLGSGVLTFFGSGATTTNATTGFVGL